MHRPMQPIAAAVLSLGWLLAVPAADAQNAGKTPTGGQTPPAAQSPSTAAPISDQKLDAAAAALQQVVSLQKNYQQQLAKAPAGDKQRITNEANDALEKAVRDQGLSVQEYSSILEVAQNDPGVRQKLMERIKTTGNSQ
jgi:predicted ATPase with chaperone activity